MITFLFGFIFCNENENSSHDSYYNINQRKRFRNYFPFFLTIDIILYSLLFIYL